MSVYASGATGFKYTFTLNDGETPGNCALINDETGRGWRLKFFESGIFTPAKNVNVDVFLVGGGGAGHVNSNGSVVSGGGGGYTKTYINVPLDGGDSYSVVVGDGGIAVSGNAAMRKGGRSGFGLLEDVDGGDGGQNYKVGGAGGSGGGGGSDASTRNADGGSDGANGNNGYGTGGEGQGLTTAEFGEEHGYLYAGGGAGGTVGKYVFQGGYGGLPTLVDGTWVYTEHSGGATGESAAPNTGGGGGGSKTAGQGAGGSGIVVIRNTRNPSFPQFTYTGTYASIDDGNGNWRIKFLTSGTFIPTSNLNVDIFAVGGGGSCHSISSTGRQAGGGGGYTQTVTSQALTGGASYAVTVGSGGSNANGGSSSFGELITALGGNMGVSYKEGGDGGSGGAGCSDSSGTASAIGGSDGYDGEDGQMAGDGGAGQRTTGVGTTTREFGEITGALYSGGGAGSPGTWPGGAGGGGATGQDGAKNTGGGGGAAGGKGGSGIVIIRNAR